MVAAVLSSCCTAAVVLMLVVRGAEDWSEDFATIWYGLFGVAVIASLLGVGTAIARRERRRLILLLSLPALVAVPVFVLIVISLVPYAD